MSEISVANTGLDNIQITVWQSQIEEDEYVRHIVVQKILLEPGEESKFTIAESSSLSISEEERGF